MACLGRGTRYDVAKRILHIMGLEHEVKLVEVDSEFFREAFPAPRPRSEMMRNYLLDLQGLNTMRPWEESLDEYLLTAFGDRCHGSAAPAARVKHGANGHGALQMMRGGAR
jgi:dTDP-4-dehydrorhamnose reductase